MIIRRQEKVEQEMMARVSHYINRNYPSPNHKHEMMTTVFRLTPNFRLLRCQHCDLEWWACKEDHDQ